MIETRVTTSQGPIHVRGLPEAFDGKRPLVFAITGAFAQRDGAMFHLTPYISAFADVMFGNLPGNHCPTVAAAEVGVYAAAYAEAVGQLAGERPVLAVGLSIGGLVTLAMDAPRVRRNVVVEPPLVMSKVWPMRDFLQGRLASEPQDADLGAYIGNIFGVLPGGRVEERRYDGLLARLSRPTRVLVGDDLLMPPRALTRGMPSLVDGPERSLLAAHPCVTLTEISGAGHNVPQQNARAFVDVLREEVARL